MDFDVRIRRGGIASSSTSAKTDPPWWDSAKSEFERDLRIRASMTHMMRDVTEAIKVAKEKLGASGWIRTPASSDFKEMLTKLIQPIQKSWPNIRVGTSILCGRAPLQPENEDAHAEALKAREPYVDEAWKNARALFKTKLDQLVLNLLGPTWVCVYEGDYGPHFLQALVKVLLLLLLLLPVLPLLLLYVSAIEYF